MTLSIDIPRCSECRRTAGWGTSHVGKGDCKDHDSEYEPGVAMEVGELNGSYSELVPNSRMRELIRYHEAQEEVDSLDAEIILLKSTLGMLAEGVGLEVRFDTTTGDVEVVEGSLGLTKQAREITTCIRALAELVRTKHQVLAAAREVIPRDDVRRYVTGIQTVLQKHLRDLCPSCHEDTGMASKVMKDLEEMPSL